MKKPVVSSTNRLPPRGKNKRRRISMQQLTYALVCAFLDKEFTTKQAMEVIGAKNIFQTLTRMRSLGILNKRYEHNGKRNVLLHSFRIPENGTQTESTEESIPPADGD